MSDPSAGGLGWMGVERKHIPGLDCIVFATFEQSNNHPMTATLSEVRSEGRRLLRRVGRGTEEEAP